MVKKKTFTAHYAFRNADFKLILVAATTNGFTFQIIDSLIQSRGYACPSVDVKSGSTGRNRFTFYMKDDHRSYSQLPLWRTL